MVAEEGSDNFRSKGVLKGLVFDFLKRGKASVPDKRIYSFEHELFSHHQQHTIYSNPRINISSFC